MVTREEAKQSVEENNGKGWLPLVDKVYDRLPDHLYIREVFEKWGVLIFHIDVQDENFENFLEDIEHESSQTCQLCGNAGYPMMVKNWETTLCNPCFQTYPEPKFKNNSFWLTNSVYHGSNGRLSLVDFVVHPNFNGKIILFLHGYMGYKDWGAWELVEKHFTDRGFGFCKFNFSHNGGTSENGIDFPDLKAFAENNYSKEVYDVQQVLNWMERFFDESQLPEIHLLGHSRGGGIALLSAKDPRVKSVITLAGISSVAQRFSDGKMLKNWETNGIRYVVNQRTKQQMPHNYSQAEDFFKNHEFLDIEKACRELEKPILAIHGDHDTSVPIEEGKQIARWTNTELHVIQEADHVFGASQPWEKEDLPEKLEEACEQIEAFISKT